MRTHCPGCGGHLLRHADAVALGDRVGTVQWCKNPRCPLRYLCAMCRSPLELVTEPIPCAKARCSNEACSRFGWEIDDNWPDRYAG